MVGLGIDIGTTSTCAVAVDQKSGEVRATLTTKTPSFLPSPKEWEKAQPAEEIFRVVKALAGQMIDRFAEICSIGLTGQMHGVVYTDRDGKSVSPLYTWQDGRGELPEENGKTYVENLSAETGFPLATGFGNVTHYYNEKNGLVPKEAVSMCTIEDYAAMALAGRKEPLLHSSCAASLGCYDIPANRFGVKNPYLPAAKKTPEILGYTEGDIPVSIAIGDNQASFLGSIQDKERSLLANVGTASQVSFAAPFVEAGGSIETRPLVGDVCLLTGNSLCGGRAYAMLEEFFQKTLAMAGVKTQGKLYGDMERLAMQMSVEEPLHFDTRYAGSRSNPSARGSISGIGIHNFTPEAFIQGVLGGIAREMLEMQRQMEAISGKKPSRLIGAGNGIRKNKLLRQEIERQFGLPIEIPIHEEEAAYGAAIFGMTSVGMFKTLDQAGALLRYG